MSRKDIVEETMDRLEGLSSELLVLLALRACWRAVPSLQDVSLLPVLGRSLAAATCLLLEHEQQKTSAMYRVVSRFEGEFTRRVSNDAKPGEQALRDMLYAVSALKDRNHDVPVLVPDDRIVDLCKKSITNALEAVTPVKEVAASCVEMDVQALMHGPLMKGQKRGRVFEVAPSEFLAHPLWERDEASEPPPEWIRKTKNWTEMARAAGLDVIGEQHALLLRGQGLDLERLWNFVMQGAADGSVEPLEGEETKGAGQVGAEDSLGGDIASLLSGGIVTATRDMPSSEDTLRRGDLVETLARMLAYPEQELPMTIALLGDWGSGKSSVIEQLKKRLREISPCAPGKGSSSEDQPGWFARARQCWRKLRKEPEREVNGQDDGRCQYLFAEFNAWRYEQTANIHAGLAQEVVKGLTAGLSPCARLRLAWRNAAARHGMEFHWTWVGTLLFALGLLVSATVMYQMGVANTVDTTNIASTQTDTKSVNGTGGTGDNPLEVILGTGWLGMLFFGLVKTTQKVRRLLQHPLASRLNTYLHLPDYGEYLGELPVIREDIKTLCETRLADFSRGRLLVVVDDLDRCQPDKISEVFDAIRLVMELDRVAVVVAIDDRIAFRAVAKHYRSLVRTGLRSADEIARDYLSKIIQLPVNLPHPDAADLGHFIHWSLFSQAVATPKIPADPAASTEGDSGHTDDKDTEEVPPPITSAAAGLAKENGLDLRGMTGSGKKGRILKKDVEALLARGPAPKKAPLPGIEESPQAEQSTNTSDGDDSETAGTDETRQEDETWRQLMKDTELERDLFTRLAVEIAFDNPRQLIRLRNAYRILKGHHARRNGGMTARDVERLLCGLFWHEFLYQYEPEVRRRAEAVAWYWGEQSDWRERADSLDQKHDGEEGTANPPVVNMGIRLQKLFPADTWEREYTSLMRHVGMTVLPHAQVGLFLQKEDVKKILKPKDVDPWQPMP